MGHANLTNISEFFLNQLHKKGKLSICECVKVMSEAGETLHASEGEYKEDYMLAMGLEQIVAYLLTYWENVGKCDLRWQRGGRKLSAVIEPAEELNDEQAKIFSQWVEDGPEFEWDEKEYHILDNIQFKFTKDWETRHDEIDPLGNVTN